MRFLLLSIIETWAGFATFEHNPCGAELRVLPEEDATPFQASLSLTSSRERFQQNSENPKIFDVEKPFHGLIRTGSYKKGIEQSIVYTDDNISLVSTSGAEIMSQGRIETETDKKRSKRKASIRKTMDFFEVNFTSLIVGPLFFCRRIASRIKLLLYRPSMIHHWK
jgi:hypothetical protein